MNKPVNKTEVKKVDFYDSYSNKLKMIFNGNENKNLILFVDKWLGTPYKQGGNTLTGTDCSGLASSLYLDVYKIKISRIAKSIYNEVNPVKKENIKDGDLLFFKTGNGKEINHVGVYISNGKFIHSSSKKGVMISDLNEEYFKKCYYSAGRIKTMSNKK